MLEAPQLVGEAVMPLKVTVLVPCDAPKLEPLITTGVPIVPEEGLRRLIDGGGTVTVKPTALLD